jgi:flagellar P-ring protein precursor FlgI
MKAQPTVLPAGLSALFILVGLLTASLTATAQVRVKDVGKLAGVEGMGLIGYGLVIGLDRTGDSPKSLFTNQALANMLERFGIAVEGEKVQSKNVAAVIVTSEVPPFHRTGSHFDVTVSSLGDAKSLQGGILLQTTLSDLSGRIWGVASGALAIGGFSIETDKVSVRENHPLVGRIPDGGVLKQDMPTGVKDPNRLVYLLNNGDFTTAWNMAEAVNAHYKDNIATAMDAKSVALDVPLAYATPGQIVNFIAEVENVEFFPDIRAKVVINERTGTIIIGQNVSLTPVAVSHGALSITIKTTPLVSQALPFAARGETVTEQVQEVTVEQRDTGVVALPGVSTVGDVATTLNRLGLNPRDIIAIFQALKEAGALQAELVII